jgi:hypothetical protein
MLSCEVVEGEVAPMAGINVQRNKSAYCTSHAADIGVRPLVPPPPNLGLVGGGVLQAVGRPGVLPDIVRLLLAAGATAVDGTMQRKDRPTAVSIGQGSVQHGGVTHAAPPFGQPEP